MVLKCYWGREHSLLYTARRDICGERIDPEVLDGNHAAKEGRAASQDDGASEGEGKADGRRTRDGRSG